MATDLLFKRALDPNPPFDLIFGQEGAEGDQSLGFLIDLPFAPQPGFSFSDAQSIAFSLFGGPPTVSTFEFSWDINNRHGPQGWTYTSYQNAQRKHSAKSTTWGEAPRLTREEDLAWTPATPLHNEGFNSWEEATSLESQSPALWENATPLHAADAVTTWEEATRLQDQTKVPWGEATPIRSTVYRATWEEATRVHHEIGGKYQEAKPLQVQWWFEWDKGTIRELSWRLPWNEGRPPPPGKSVHVIPPVEGDLCYYPPGGLNVNLTFSALLDLTRPTNLYFVCLTHGITPPPSYVIPYRKVYVVLNTLHFIRVKDGVEIGLYSANTSIDKTTWAWTFNATIPFTDLAKIEPDSDGPVEVQLTVNGFVWRFLVEDYDYNQVFSSNTLNIRGRSVTALLDDPYATQDSYVQAQLLTSRQYAQMQLDRSGYTGFDLDWTLIDPLGWQMPTNTFNYNLQTPVQVMKAIAEGVGGYLNSHPSAKFFQFRSSYPSMPWDWATTAADISLPNAIITSKKLSWTEKPDYDGVYVSGQNTGVIGLVNRNGTIGGYQAPMFVNAMVSDEAAGREAGRSVLGQGGKQATVTIDLPLSVETGLFVPGKLVQFNSEQNWKGLTRAIAVSVSIDSKGLISVSQSSQIERHYVEAV